MIQLDTYDVSPSLKQKPEQQSVAGYIYCVYAVLEKPQLVVLPL